MLRLRSIRIPPEVFFRMPVGDFPCNASAEPDLLMKILDTVSV